MNENRKLMISLLKEISPDTIVYNLMIGKITAEQMINEIDNGTETGLQWSSDLLRISRNLLIRQVNK